VSIEQSHGKARPTLPRSRELFVTGKDPDQSNGSTEKGPFAPAHGRKFRKGRWSAFFAEALGRDVDSPGAREIGRKAWKLYRGYLAELPCVTVSTRSLCAARARAATLADFYASLGTRSGPHTEKGATWLGEALKWDQRAERLTVTCLDVSARQARTARERQPTTIIDLIEARAEEYLAAARSSNGGEP